MIRAPTWSVRLDEALSGAENMALDHTLARDLPGDRGWIRLYRWSAPTLSLGRNEPALGVVDAAALQEDGVDLVRRPTGGRSVLHDHELTYAVVAPIRALGGVRATYALINRALAEGLAHLGIPAVQADDGPVEGLDAGPCFRGAAPGEVVARGRKLVGSAQVRIGDALLQHGSILLRNDQWRISRYLTRNPQQDPRPATVEELLGRSVAPEEVAQAVRLAFQAVLPGDWRRAPAVGSLERGDRSSPAPDLLERYRSHEWSWRR